MNIGEKIVAAEEKIGKIRDALAAIGNKSIEENRDLTDDETDQIEAYEGELESTEKSLVGLRTLYKTLSATVDTGTKMSKSATSAPGLIVPATVKASEGAFPILTKMAVIKALAHVQKTSPAAIIQERYAHDARVAPAFDFYERAATDVATTTGVGWAAELVQDDTVGFINELKAMSIYGAMASGGTAIPFGMNNSVTVPYRSGTGNVSGSFVGEGNSIPVKADNYGSVVFNRFKAAVITVFTEELARTSTPQVETLLRDAILTDTGDMLDSVIMNPANSLVAGIRPASPWFGAATQVSAGDDQASILTDIRFLMDTLTNANAGRMPALIISPSRLSGLSMLTNSNGGFVFRDEIAMGNLMGIPFIKSTNCPADQVYIIDLADFGTAFGVPEFTVSDQVTLAMANDDGVAPTMADTNAITDAGSLHISDAAGTTPPTQVRSMFQTWSVALRNITPISWGMMRTGTTAYLTGVSW